MMTSISAFIVPTLALLLSLAGLVGLWRLRKRLRPTPIRRPACPGCRYAIDDPSRACSECGADLATIGVIDADWPRRRVWIIRGAFVLLFVLPLPVGVAGVGARFAPGLHREAVAHVLGVADDAGIAQEALLVVESRRWFARGTSVNGSPPADVPPTVELALPPTDRGQWITAPDPQAERHVVVSRGGFARDALGDGPYPRRARHELGGTAAAALDLADAVVAGGTPAASAAAGRTRHALSSGTGTSASSGRDGGSRFERSSWTYRPLPPGTVVPLARITWRTSRDLMPRRETVVLLSGLVGAGLLLSGWWRSRRFRPRPLSRPSTPPMPGPTDG